MIPTFIFFLHSFSTLTLGFYQNVDTTLEKKCDYLNTRTTSAYVGNSCFVTTSEKYTTTLSEWHKLHQHCKELAGYSGRMAFIRSRQQINALLKKKIIELSGRYYIGAKQDPPSDCGDRLCRYEDPEHHKNWYFIDAEGRKQGKLPDLWLNNEPNNQGVNPPENIVTLEQLQSSKLGFNDGNGQAQDFPILCEYEDILHCPSNYTMIGKKCFKAFTDPATPDDAQRNCENDGAKLASIHDDRTNQHIADMARKELSNNYDERRETLQQWGPYLIGLQFDGSRGRWRWLDGTDTDYYRWYAQSGGSATVKFKPSSSRYNYVYLQTSTNANDGSASFGYWSNNLNSDDRLPYICQTTPNIVK